MAFTLSEKAQKVLTLLLGLRHPEVAQKLAAYGFTQADLEEGFRLLRALTQAKLEPLNQAPINPNLLLLLDNWENHWFPIAQASLKRRFPSVHDKIFTNLSQAEGKAVIVSVQTFTNRIASLEDSGEEAQARDLLNTRGLTPEVLAEAQQMLDKLNEPKPPKEVDPEALREAQDRAEEELWAFYLEWSAIARASITDKRLLRQMGFGKKGKSSKNS